MSMRMLLIALVLPSATYAQQAEPEWLSPEETAETSRQFAHCAGVYDWSAAVERKQGRSASAEMMGNLSNGAEFAAQWLLAMEHNRLHPDDPKSTGAMAPLVKPGADAGALSMRALEEHADVEGMKRALEVCRGLGEAQEAIVQLARRQAAGL